MPRRVAKRHRMLCVVRDYDSTKGRWVSWQPSCTCHWWGDVTRDKARVRAQWDEHERTAHVRDLIGGVL